ncbi:MAG: hypothetical protein P8I59_03245, partial [Pseudomonadales bacterium]|nr:hypothetical protein [Pseudomonadales bacterium]
TKNSHIDVRSNGPHRRSSPNVDRVVNYQLDALAASCASTNDVIARRLRLNAMASPCFGLRISTYPPTLSSEPAPHPAN